MEARGGDRDPAHAVRREERTGPRRTVCDQGAMGSDAGRDGDGEVMAARGDRDGGMGDATQ